VIPEPRQLGLVLTGGGARSAYQVGVLRGIADLLRRGSACPFPIITGTSAGAVSAIALASDAAHFRRSIKYKEGSRKKKRGEILKKKQKSKTQKKKGNRSLI